MKAIHRGVVALVATLSVFFAGPTVCAESSKVVVREDGGQVLSADELKKVVPTAVFSGNNGTHDFTHTFKPDGTVWGQSSDMGNSYSDVGEWTIKGNKLCATWNKWGSRCREVVRYKENKPSTDTVYALHAAPSR